MDLPAILGQSVGPTLGLPLLTRLNACGIVAGCGIEDGCGGSAQSRPRGQNWLGIHTHTLASKSASVHLMLLTKLNSLMTHNIQTWENRSMLTA